MKTTNIILAACLVAIPFLTYAHNETPHYLPEGHAPAGVMADHRHKQGEWMFGYRLMSRTFSGLYRGGDKVSTTTAAHAGFATVATDMDMTMHMLDIMYALSDDITLMLMPQYMSMDMSMAPTPGGHATGHGAGHAAVHDHGVSGIGDTIAAALIRLPSGGNSQAHATVGISIPTGSVDEKDASGRFLHYGMQLGSGTWDLVPNLTWTTQADTLSYGAQLGAVLRLENENDSGFAFGDKYFATGWSAYRLANWLSVSLRLQYEQEGDIDGHYNGPHNHSSPPDLQANYGGEFVDWGLGINVVAQSGPLAGIRLGIEWIDNLKANYNGYQTGRDDGLNVSLTYAF